MSPEPSHVALPFTAPEMLTFRAVLRRSAVMELFASVANDAVLEYAGTAPKDTPVSFVVTLEAPPMTLGISQPIFTYAVPARALSSNVNSLRVHSPAGTLK